MFVWPVPGVSSAWRAMSRECVLVRKDGLWQTGKAAHVTPCGRDGDNLGAPWFQVAEEHYQDLGKTESES